MNFIYYRLHRFSVFNALTLFIISVLFISGCGDHLPEDVRLDLLKKETGSGCVFFSSFFISSGESVMLRHLGWVKPMTQATGRSSRIGCHRLC